MLNLVSFLASLLLIYVVGLLSIHIIQEWRLKRELKREKIDERMYLLGLGTEEEELNDVR